VFYHWVGNMTRVTVMKRLLSALSFWLLLAASALANVPCSVPNTFVNNTIADANQVNANFTAIINCLTNAAVAGANSDITSLNALSTPITPVQGGSTIFVGTTVSGTANAPIIANTVPSGFTLTKGSAVMFLATADNTGTMQLNVNSTGLTNFYNTTPTGPQAMSGGEIQMGQLIIATYDGTQFQYTSTGPQFGGFGQVVPLVAAASTDLGTVATHNVNVQGATTITDFGASASTVFPLYMVTFTGGGIITASTTNCSTVGGCILTPGNVNIQTTVGDFAFLQYLGKGSNPTPPGKGNWQVAYYQRNNAILSPTPPCGFNHLVWGNGTSTTVVTASWDAASITTATGSPLYSGPRSGLTFNSTLGTGTSTAGGMDGRVPPTNAFIYMYAISDGVNWNLLGSTASSVTAINLPTPVPPATPYTYACYMGAIKTAPSTSQLMATQGRGRVANYIQGGVNVPTLPVILQGASTPMTAFLVVPTQVPANAVTIKFAIGNTAATPGQVQASPNGTTGYIEFGGSNSSAGIFEFVLEGTSIYLSSSNASIASSAYGWTDAVNAN
jgi:hypothetical protein